MQCSCAGQSFAQEAEEVGAEEVELMGVMQWVEAMADQMEDSFD